MTCSKGFMLSEIIQQITKFNNASGEDLEVKSMNIKITTKDSKGVVHKIESSIGKVKNKVGNHEKNN
jgi:hypothetical protein